MQEDELEVVPLLQLGLASGTFDHAWLTRLGRAADGLRLLAGLDRGLPGDFEGRRWSPGPTSRTAMELAAQLGGDFRRWGPRAAGHLPQAARAVVDRASRRAHRGELEGGRHAGTARRSRRCRSLT